MMICNGEIDRGQMNIRSVCEGGSVGEPRQHG